ncbi:MAG: NifU family protein [Clostridia bacterium]|nr:NifU family protein [Clostridia bacterium]
MKDYINGTLSPLLQGDGGYIEYIEENGDEIKVLARGECSKCGKLSLCLNWCEERILKDKNRRVKLIPVRKKPFFWDK